MEASLAKYEIELFDAFVKMQNGYNDLNKINKLLDRECKDLSKGPKETFMDRLKRNRDKKIERPLKKRKTINDKKFNKLLTKMVNNFYNYCRDIAKNKDEIDPELSEFISAYITEDNVNKLCAKVADNKVVEELIRSSYEILNKSL